jgi:SAM-dependent methyltransferase
MPPSSDDSNGYEALADRFIATREQSNVGAATVGGWARARNRRSTIIDLACGSGIPITKALIDAGHTVFAVDASPTMVRALASRFPQVTVACESIERSTFFNRTFDAAVAWGVVFLLRPGAQRLLFERVARTVRAGGRFLFTAPWQTATWSDLLTGRESVSLGRDEYRRLWSAAGFTLGGEFDDEGGNHYYDLSRGEAGLDLTL